MITLTRTNGTKIFVSAGSVEYVEASSHTTLQLVSGERVVLRESAAEVVAKIRAALGVRVLEGTVSEPLASTGVSRTHGT